MIKPRNKHPTDIQMSQKPEKQTCRHSEESKTWQLYCKNSFDKFSPVHIQWMIPPSKFALLFCIVHFSLEYQLGHLFGIAVLYASRLVVPHLKLKIWGHEGKPFSKWTIWGCLGHVIDFCNVALKPSLHMDSILIRYLLITRSEVFPVFATVARLSGTSEPGPVVLAAHQGCISTYTTPLWSLHASLRRGKSLKFWTKRGWVFEKTKAPSPEVHGVGTLLFLTASPLPLRTGE